MIFSEKNLVFLCLPQTLFQNECFHCKEWIFLHNICIQFLYNIVLTFALNEKNQNEINKQISDYF